MTPSPLFCKTPIMTHPGLPLSWAILVGIGVLLLTLWTVWRTTPTRPPILSFSLNTQPLIGPLLNLFTNHPWPLLILRTLFVGVFFLVIFAGLMGTPIPERNLATVLTWNIWWTLVIVSVFFFGTSWCGLCPWDTLAGWLVRRKAWQRGDSDSSLNWKVPRALRTVWPALIMLIGLTWLELGLGVTVDPRATALLAVLIAVLTIISLALFERKAFCRYFCPVGRTLGFYSQLSPVELRPIQKSTCNRCQTLDCYHGTKKVQPCPTFLTMGRFLQNTYCLSCGSCSMSCPDNNVGWHLRSMANEARQAARPHWDEAWFMLGLLFLTTLHGVTMIPQWEESMMALAKILNDSGRMLTTFSLAMLAMMVIPLIFYGVTVLWTHHLVHQQIPFRKLFSNLAFAALPMAFAYHLAHNLNHLIREGDALWGTLANPLGQGLMPLSKIEQHARMLDPLIGTQTLAAVQAFLLLWGFWLTVSVLSHRGRNLLADGNHINGWQLMPMLIFSIATTALNTWLLAQDMVMRL